MRIHLMNWIAPSSAFENPVPVDDAPVASRNGDFQVSIHTKFAEDRRRPSPRHDGSPGSGSLLPPVFRKRKYFVFRVASKRISDLVLIGLIPATFPDTHSVLFSIIIRFRHGSHLQDLPGIWRPVLMQPVLEYAQRPVTISHDWTLQPGANQGPASPRKSVK